MVVAPALAQDYPKRPVKAIVAVGAGGTGDVFTRVLGDELAKRWGQPLVIENRVGAQSNIGARACAEAPPDGYTLCVLPGEPLAYNQHLFKKLPFDPAKDFEPITNLFFNFQALVVNANLNVKTVDELVALSKAKAGTLSYTAPSLPLTLYLEKLKRERGADWVGIPFKGGGETTNAILSGSTPIAFLGLQNFISHLRAGTMTGWRSTARSARRCSPTSRRWRSSAIAATSRGSISRWWRRPARRRRSSTRFTAMLRASATIQRSGTSR